MSIRDELLEQIVIASGGVVRNPNNRNMLLEDWLLAVDNPIPVGALIYYNFAYSTLSTAITEQVGKVNTVYTTRASNINIEQTLSGQVVTYAAGVAAFDRGQNMQVWNGATNEVVNSSDIATYGFSASGVASTPIVTKDFALAPDGSMTATRIQMNINGGTTSNDFARVLTVMGTALANVDYTQSLFMKSNDANTYQVGSVIKSQSNSDNYEVTPEWQRLEKTSNTASVDVSSGIQLRATFGQSDAIDILIWMSPKMGHQIEQSSSATPFIYTNGAPATRAPTASSISTFTNPAYWIDSPLDGGGVNAYFYGDRNDGDWVGGVNPLTAQIDHWGNGGVNSKYFGLVTDALIGTIATAGESEIKYVSRAGDSFTVEVIKGSILDFSYPAGIKGDYTQSAYFTGSLAADSLAVFNLRVAAGDLAADLNALGVPALIPANDFEISMAFTYYGQPLPFGKVVSSSLDANNRWWMQNNGTTVTFNAVVGGVNTGVTSAVTLIEGNNYDVSISVATSGATLIINGVSGVKPSLTQVVHGSALTLFNLDRRINGGISEITVRPI